MDKTLVLSELEKTKRTDEIQKLLNVFIEKWNNHELAVRITIKESAALDDEAGDLQGNIQDAKDESDNHPHCK